MIRQKEKSRKHFIIDLTGPHGNAFYLIKQAQVLAPAYLGTFADAIIAEMQSGDYEHLVQTFDKYFGDFVILER